MIQRIIYILGFLSKLKWNFSFLKFICHWSWYHEEKTNYPTRHEKLRITTVRMALADSTVMQSYELPGRWARNVGDLSHYSSQKLYSAPCWKHSPTVQCAETQILSAPHNWMCQFKLLIEWWYLTYFVLLILSLHRFFVVTLSVRDVSFKASVRVTTWCSLFKPAYSLSPSSRAQHQDALSLLEDDSDSL